MTILSFNGNKVKRHLKKRDAQSVQKERLNNPYFIFLHNDIVIYHYKAGRAELYCDENTLSRFQIDWEKACLLGWEQERPVLAAPLFDIPETLPDGFYHIALKESYKQGLFISNQSGALAQAVSLLSWHKNNSFCARCGHETVMSDGGMKRICHQCQIEHFPRVDPVVIMLVHYEDYCLLARSPHFEQNNYSCLAGFVEQGETLEMAVRRESLEEMGVAIGEVNYYASQPWPFSHSLMLGCYAKALNLDVTIDHNEIEAGRWFSKQEVSQIIAHHHPENITLPPEGAIAHFLIKQWWKSKNNDILN
ncbi:NAD(+) diphosphatase [Bartonella tamiae]|uniref:NAD(+) diphosphatase n=1 Tax=Bartonella tamiae Th239 TaxID=1094558 RepID=J0ZRF7_9HYPH|nr:NAD(+) diphosphatase [Bartonella tamiae]EJF91278.1 hypothetical protein ME5_00610 [Bartonella tamiae Th239]EJF93057.1 hypothetical protein MEG_01271 [Bartonella tamiae Th307]